MIRETFWPILNVNTRSSPEKILFYLALVFFISGGLLRAWFMDFSDFDYGVYSDHFINAVTAKNIAHGLGWSSSGYETYLLNPENLTVGPTVILPVSTAIAFFGNKLTLPGVSIFLLNIFLLVLVLRALKSLFPDEKQFYLCGFLLVLLFTFFKSYYWYRMIGEIPAVLLLLLTTIYLHTYLQKFTLSTLLAAAIAGSFALGTKELAVLPIIVMTFVITCASWQHNKKISVWLGRPIVFLFLCFLLPGLFFIYRYTLLHSQPEQWQSAYFIYAKSIHDYYSGTNILYEYLAQPENFANILRRVTKATLWNGGTLLQFSLVGMRGLQYWLSVFAVLFAYLLASRKFFALSMLMVLSAFPLLVWFFCIAEKAMPRHLFIGLYFSALATIFYLCFIQHALLRNVLAGVFILFVILTGDKSSRLLLVSWPTQSSPVVLSITDVQQKILASPEKSLAWMSMVDNNEFEYLSQTPNNFVSGFDMISESIELNESAYRKTHPKVDTLINAGQYRSAFDYYTSPENNQREIVAVNFTKPIDFNWLHFKRAVIQFRHSGFNLTQGELCKEIIYQNEYYLIEHCSASDIQASLAKDGGLPIRPRKWLSYILLPAERWDVF